MKITHLLGVSGVALCVACGGGADDGGGEERSATRISGPNNPIHVPIGYDTIVPGGEASVYGNNPIWADILSGTNPLYKGAVAQDDLLNKRYEYVLHGSDADLDAWLTEGDVVVERSQAGDLTYAVVLTASLRDVPTSLLP